MRDDSVKTIRGTFPTREAADRAIEHLVQEHGINRADVFVQTADTKNTSGTAPPGGDALKMSNKARASVRLFKAALRCRPTLVARKSKGRSRPSAV